MTNPCHDHAAESARADYMKEAFETWFKRQIWGNEDFKTCLSEAWQAAMLAHIQRGAVPVYCTPTEHEGRIVYEHTSEPIPNADGFVLYAAAPAPAEVPSEADAERMGAKGAPATEGERLAFEAWMRGHCWALCATWTGTQYRSDAEQGGEIDPRAMMTRQLWAAWRDRAALAARQGAGLTQAATDVLAERQRQISNEGWTPEHDDEHVCDEIAAMACFYAMPPGARDRYASSTGYGASFGAAILPEGWEPKTGDRRRELIKAGALIIAEIERLDRADLRHEAQP